MGLFAKFKEAWLKPMSFDSLNEGFYDDLEEALILADVGMDTAVDAVAQLKKRAYAKLLTHEEDVKNALRDILTEKLSVGDPALDLSTRPSVALIIGVNGVGKTTLFKTIVGLEPLTSGNLEIGETVKISYVDQMRGGIDPDKTLWEVVSDGLDIMQVAENEVPSRAYVASFGFKGQDQQKRAGVLSGGERNRLNLALTLKQGGNLLLLDEPTNDLDVETLSALESALLEFPGCSVVISHDRMFLDRVATHILAWEGTDENPGNWYWFEGNFEQYQENRVARLGEDAAKPHRVHRKLTRD